MVARDDPKALPMDAHPTAPILLEYFLEALAKREGRDPHLQVTISPSADQSADTPEPVPAAGGPVSRLPFSK
jgi:hypothetical protein